MELRRTAELVLRSSASSFSSTFSSRICRSTTSLNVPTTISRSMLPSRRSAIASSRRHITTTPAASQQAAAAKKEDDDAEHQQPETTSPRDSQRPAQVQHDRPRGPSTSESSETNDYRDLVEKRLDFTRPAPTPSPSSNPSSSSSTPSARDVIDTFRRNLTANRGRGRDTSNLPPASQSGGGGGGSVFDSLHIPTRNTPSSSRNVLLPSRARPIEEATQPPPFLVSPRLGRTISLSEDRNIDLARAFRLLDARTGSNKVRSDVAAQRFHERPGLRRKRLKSQRWRRRFKADFQATVRRVQALKRMGW